MKFEDLEVWKRSARLSADLYKEMQQVKDFGFRDQITRAGLSVPSNIAEGFERQSDKEFVNFLSHARGSCGELRTQVYIGMEIGYRLNMDSRLLKMARPARGQELPWTGSKPPRSRSPT